MIRLAWQGVRHAWGRTVALGAGLLVASVAFSLLTASVDVGVARVKGDVGANWRGAYDLLVVPRGAITSWTAQHLVQVNYLSAADSGITMGQYERIERQPGVGIAAPLAVVGYVLETVRIPVALSPAAVGPGGARVLLVSSRYTADQGLSRYPARLEGYVYLTPDQLSPAVYGDSGPTFTERLPGGASAGVCPVGARGEQPASPFSTAGGQLAAWCYSLSDPASAPEGFIAWSFPVLVAGIDPSAENRLDAIAGAVSAGRYLGEGEQAGHPFGTATVIPVLGSTSSFDGDSDQVTVSTLPQAAVRTARSGAPAASIAAQLAAAPATPVMRLTITAGQAWQALLGQLASPIANGIVHGGQQVGQYWTAGPVRYAQRQRNTLDAIPVTSPGSVWAAGANLSDSTFVAAPPAAADTGFRRLTEHAWVTDPSIVAAGSTTSMPFLQLVGQFDPTRIEGFAAAGPGAALASYRSALLTGADAVSRLALAGGQLQPDANMAGYAQQPPLLLTTLSGAGALEAPAAAAGADGGAAAAPIGSVRVRVDGLRGTLPEQLGRVGAVGREIEQATGLRVIVTAGASPRQVIIGLPAGQYGRPGLRLAAQWTELGVALVVLRQVSRESVALFVLILIVCGLFLGTAATAGVRGRGTEVGTLRSLGWGRRQVLSLVLGETAVLGVLAGLAGTGVSVLLITLLRLHVPAWRALLVLPVAAVLACLAGLWPAWLAARAEPAQALFPRVRAPRRGGFAIRSVTGLAVTGLVRTPGRGVLAAAALGGGVAGLSVLLAAFASFRHSVGDSALAGLVTASARGTDLAGAVLAVGLGAAAVADVSYLHVRERAGELAALAACGWGTSQVIRLLLTESVLVAAAGSVAGGAAGLAAAVAAFGVSGPVLAGAAVATAAGLLLATAATAGVLMSMTRPLAEILAADGG